MSAISTELRDLARHVSDPHIAARIVSAANVIERLEAEHRRLTRALDETVRDAIKDAAAVESVGKVVSIRPPLAMIWGGLV